MSASFGNYTRQPTIAGTSLNKVSHAMHVHICKYISGAFFNINHYRQKIVYGLTIRFLHYGFSRITGVAMSVVQFATPHPTNLVKLKVQFIVTVPKD